MKLSSGPLAQGGLARSLTPYEMPLALFSDMKNMRAADDKLHKAYGDVAKLNAQTVYAAHMGLLHNYSTFVNYWMVCEPDAVWAFDDLSSTLTDITRASGAYTAAVYDRWNLTEFAGVGIVNNGADIPQAWGTMNLATKLIDLPNWPSTYRASVIRPYLNYLIALGITINGNYYPHIIKWSHSADEGVPTSWDHTDPTVDAGENIIADSPDELVDCLTLGQYNIIYKEYTTWVMGHTGGQYIFAFRPLFQSFGMMAQGCAAPFKHMHFVLSRDDVIVHDGSQPQSIVDKRMRSWLFANVEETSRHLCFVQPLPSSQEIWLCFPQTGASLITNALVWNWDTNSWSVRDLPNIRSVAVSYPIGQKTSDSWNYETSLNWNSETDLTWEANFIQLQTDSKVRYGSIEGTVDSPLCDILELSKTNYKFDATDYRSFLERTGIIFQAKNARGEPQGDARYALLQSIWPKIDAEIGDIVSIYVAATENLNETLSWQDPVSFTIGTDEKIDLFISGRYFAIRIEATNSFVWSISSYELEYSILGEH